MIRYARVRSWAWPEVERKYGRLGAWWHVNRDGFTLRYRDHLLLVAWR